MNPFFTEALSGTIPKPNQYRACFFQFSVFEQQYFKVFDDKISDSR